MSCTIRDAQRGDEVILIDLINGLADYEKESGAVRNTPEKLAVDLFDSKICEALIAEREGEILGYAFYYTSYSTWNGPCMFLEDLYLRPEARGTGAGKKLFDRVVEIAQERDYARMDWQILDWNTPAIEFFTKRGAHIDNDWLNGRLFFR